jgi:uncharacterized protein YqeY
MSIAETIEKDYREAYKAGEKVRLGALRLLKTAAKNRQVELLRPLEPLSDEEYLDVLLKQAKQRQDSIEQFRAAKRDDLADREAAEWEILRGYLPRPLAPDELDGIVAGIGAPFLAGGMKMMGKVIQTIMTEYKGRAEGKAVSEAVRAYFQQNSAR